MKYAVTILMLQSLNEKLSNMNEMFEMAKKLVDDQKEKCLLLKVHNELLKADNAALKLRKALLEKAEKEARAEDEASPKDEKDELLDMKVEECGFCIRTTKTLQHNDIKTVRDIVRLNKTDLLKFHNAGRKTLTEIDDFLYEKGLGWGMEV